MKKKPIKNQNVSTPNKSNTKNILVGFGMVILLYLLFFITPSLLDYASELARPDTPEWCNFLNSDSEETDCLLKLARQTRNIEVCQWINTSRIEGIYGMSRCFRNAINPSIVPVDHSEKADLSENICDAFPESKKEDCFTAFALSFPYFYFYFPPEICARAPYPRQCEIILIVNAVRVGKGLEIGGRNFTVVLTNSNFSVTQLNSSICEEIITNQPERDLCYDLLLLQDFGESEEICSKFRKSLGHRPCD